MQKNTPVDDLQAPGLDNLVYIVRMVFPFKVIEYMISKKTQRHVVEHIIYYQW